MRHLAITYGHHQLLMGGLTIRWNGPGMLRDFITKLYDVSE